MADASHIEAALALMLQAHSYSTELACEAWEFAVEIVALRQAGLTNSDLRWLLHRSLVEQAQEVTMPGESRRRFGPRGGSLLCDQSCFILTAAGVLLGQSGDSLFPCVGPLPPAELTIRIQTNGDKCPCWDKDRRALWFDGELVKQFKVPAQNQETILATFEEEKWPPRVDDPLSMHFNIDPKRRLHDTINSLNRNQRVNRLRFLGDGSGQAILWEPIAAADNLETHHQYAGSDAAPRGAAQNGASHRGRERAAAEPSLRKLHHIAPSLPASEG